MAERPDLSRGLPMGGVALDRGFDARPDERSTLVTEDGESGSAEGVEPFEPTLRDIKPADGVEGEGLGVDEPGAGIERGAVIEGDKDALAAAAKTSLDMDGFQTGAGFDLEDSPDEAGADLEVEALEVRSSTFDDADLAEAETASSAGAGGAARGVDWYADGEGGAAPGVDWYADRDLPVDKDDGLKIVMEGEDDPAIVQRDDFRTTEPADDWPSEASTDTYGEAGESPRYSGLERLERKRRRSRRLGTFATAVLALGAGGLLMGYFGVVQIPGITPLDLSSVVVAAPVVLPGPQPESPVMSHVVFVDAWGEAETPLAWAAALRQQMPELLGFVTALLIDGERQYALVVGPGYSEAQARALKRPLETAFVLLNPDPESWTVREVPYSFFFGEYEGLGPANARVQELADLSVPALVLRVSYPAGATAFRVYGGAFADEFEATGMGQLLVENRLRDVPLTERRGWPPD